MLIQTDSDRVSLIQSTSVCVHFRWVVQVLNITVGVCVRHWILSSSHQPSLDAVALLYLCVSGDELSVSLQYFCLEIS